MSLGKRLCQLLHLSVLVLCRYVEVLLVLVLLVRLQNLLNPASGLVVKPPLYTILIHLGHLGVRIRIIPQGLEAPLFLLYLLSQVALTILLLMSPPFFNPHLVVNHNTVRLLPLLLYP